MKSSVITLSLLTAQLACSVHINEDPVASKHVHGAHEVPAHDNSMKNHMENQRQHKEDPVASRHVHGAHDVPAHDNNMKNHMKNQRQHKEELADSDFKDEIKKVEFEDAASANAAHFKEARCETDTKSSCNVMSCTMKDSECTGDSFDKTCKCTGGKCAKEQECVEAPTPAPTPVPTTKGCDYEKCRKAACSVRARDCVGQDCGRRKFIISGPGVQSFNLEDASSALADAGFTDAEDAYKGCFDCSQKYTVKECDKCNKADREELCATVTNTSPHNVRSL